MLEERDDLIGAERPSGGEGAGLDNHIIGVFFHAGHKPDALLSQGFEPVVVGIATIDDDDGAGMEAQLAGHVNLVGFALGKDREAGQVTVMV